MIKTIIIDKNDDDRNRLLSLIQTHCPNVEVAAVGNSLEETRLFIQRYQPKLLFIDVNLPPTSGLKLFEMPEAENISVVLTSNQSKYARKAFKTKAIHYLLKPILVDDLNEAVRRVSENSKVKEKGAVSQPPSCAETSSFTMQERVQLPTVDGFIFAKTSEISHFVAAGRKYILHFDDGYKVEINCKFGRCIQQFNRLPFVQVHRSTIVNANKVKEYRKGQENLLILDSGKKIPIGKNFKNKVHQALVDLGLLAS